MEFLQFYCCMNLIAATRAEGGLVCFDQIRNLLAWYNIRNIILKTKYNNKIKMILMGFDTIEINLVYHFSLTQFWPNFEIMFLWPTTITTIATSTRPTVTTTTTKTTTSTTTTTKTTTTFLGCDSIELNLIDYYVMPQKKTSKKNGWSAPKIKKFTILIIECSYMMILRWVFQTVWENKNNKGLPSRKKCIFTDIVRIGGREGGRSTPFQKNEKKWFFYKNWRGRGSQNILSKIEALYFVLFITQSGQTKGIFVFLSVPLTLKK